MMRLLLIAQAHPIPLWVTTGPDYRVADLADGQGQTIRKHDDQMAFTLIVMERLITVLSPLELDDRTGPDPVKPPQVRVVAVGQVLIDGRIRRPLVHDLWRATREEKCRAGANQESDQGQS